jgi:hypothetical protein
MNAQAVQVIGRNRAGWLAAYWTDSGDVAGRVIATPVSGFPAGPLTSYGWVKAEPASIAQHGGDVTGMLSAHARGDGYEPVTEYPLHAFCHRCGQPVSLGYGDSGWHHDGPGSRAIVPCRGPQPLPGDIELCGGAAALKDEREQLAARIAEIDASLATTGETSS